MVPAAIVSVAALPLTPNGKLDRKALPDPDFAAGTALVPPETETQALLCELFQEVTGVAELGVDHDFFELGGHSLSAMRLVANLRRRTGKEIPLRMLFERPSPRRLATFIDDGSLVPSYTPLLPLRRTGKQPPLFCIHPAYGLAICYQTLADQLDADIPVWGLQARGLESGEEPHASIDHMAEAYAEAILSVEPHGPYRLLGWSLGGHIAHAVACALEARGRPVSHLVLLDTPTAVSYSDGLPTEQDIDADVLKHGAEELGFAPGEMPVERDQALEAIMNAAVAEGFLPEGVSLDVMKNMMASFHRAPTLVQRHRLGRCRAPLILFVAGVEPEEDDVEGEFHWDRHTSSTVNTVTIDCPHLQMMYSENVGTIARELTRLLASPAG